MSKILTFGTRNFLGSGKNFFSISYIFGIYIAKKEVRNYFPKIRELQGNEEDNIITFLSQEL